MASAFISYHRADSAALATLVATSLQQSGIDAYVDTRSGDAGGLFPDRLRRAIEDSDVFICLLGKSTLQSKWVLEEIEHAHNLRKPMIPVFQEHYVPPDRAPNEHVAALLQHDGVHIFDIKNLYVDDAIERLEQIIHNSTMSPTRSTGSNRARIMPGSLVIGAVLIGALVIVAATLINSNGDRELAALQTPIPTTVVAQVGATDTDIPTATIAPSPTPTDTPVPTATPTETAVPPRSTPTSTETPMEIPTASPTSTETETPTPSPTATPVSVTPTVMPQSRSYPCEATVDPYATASILTVVRQSPNSSTTIASVRRGEQVLVIDRSAGAQVFYRIQSNGRTIGWIAAEYLELSPTCPEG
ncbi:MAG: TIR domain-containing protein [Anaerolineae bacterium]|nr:TIR domain-containing protein [Anaerolineae bacterium]